jgi:nitronate monooxygenase
MWPKSDLTDLLKIRHPVIQAPMAGSATVALAAAVSNTGGLGSLGLATTPLDKVRSEVCTLQTVTRNPFNLNFFVHEMPQGNKESEALTRKRLEPFYECAGLDQKPVSSAPPFGVFDKETVALLLELQPAVVSFHFGLPEASLLNPLKDAGCIILCSATTVAEAKMLESDGADAVIAQGWEAGGHRAGFDRTPDDFGIGTMALVPQIVDAVNLPVIAAGGIADGRGIAAAFALGASGVQMGTAFLSCPEASVSDVHRSAIRNATEQDTRLTSAFSGRPARAKNNRYIETLAEHRQQFPDFPLMYNFIDPLRKKDTRNLDYQFLLYGQAARLNRDLPASELLATLVEEALDII